MLGARCHVTIACPTHFDRCGPIIKKNWDEHGEGTTAHLGFNKENPNCFLAPSN
jgi:hypothetical protein